MNCRIDPNRGAAPNNGNLASYLFFVGDVFTHTVHVTEVDFELWSDSATLANAFALTVYSYSESNHTYSTLGETIATYIFPWLGNGAVPTVRFIFEGGGVLVPVPEGQGPLPVVLQITQLSGLTLTMGANLISNAGTLECPISASEAASIPIQIFAE